MSALFHFLGQRLPSIPYGPSSNALRGYWVPVTSTINWCEEDYYATIYSAEFVNTLTNLMFVLLAIKGVSNVLRNDHDRVFLITYGGYATVGLGSLAFHATLKYPMQLVDELSMIYTTCFSVFASFSYRRSTPVATLIAIFLASLAIYITAHYHYLGDPKFHQTAYAILTTVMLLRSMFVMETTLRPSLKRLGKKNPNKPNAGTKAKKDSQSQDAQDRRDLSILKRMWAMAGYGIGIFLVGFGIWQLDNRYCSTLRTWRREVGLPWGILLEGHGWWHVMTGIGAYFLIQWAVWIRVCLNGKQDLYELYWPSLIFSIPLVVKKSGSPDSYLVQDKVKKQS